MPAALSDATTRHELFASTRWTLVLEAGANSSGAARAALDELCRIYWPAIYTFLRRRGYDQQDAQDLTQSFFQHVLENETLRRASRERGRFRNFLLGALKLSQGASVFKPPRNLKAFLLVRLVYFRSAG